MTKFASHANQKILTALERLIDIVAKLRSPLGGCPWDLAQTQESLIPYIIEEAYEAVDAIYSQNQAEIAEELGDLLLQVVLQAQIAQENEYFTLEDIAEGISEKLIRRHPHVFGDVEVASEEEVHHNWEKIKQEEKQKTHALLSEKLKTYVRSLPPLMATLKISKQAAKAGFEWENVEGVWDKFQEELKEFQEAIIKGDLQHAETELGDLLFTVVNLGRWYGIDPTVALQGTNNRFIQRLSLMEQKCDRPLQEYSLTELEVLWQSAKKQLSIDE
ncbi:nucleoside triphosphate pyrophosphohydrolase [Cyanobacterium aponinum AL20118]|uniref:MazG family protein n=3 Tax=Cyanobacterium aponinum TaxID=379064 RepID=K9ZAJ5_CYAAP|nr:nucleoside triphosphate pyrophosphohydrolase [Cyanobacterium aponinum]AFZ55418.1 MazG family protein [Cyanobacterium aponinum PCC 10605]MTF40107.1 nucleoside triphosphate pyrophosphohydrolase [Cyanobacterium aponinum 0216]WPF88588.1 nucleoside triphosphate pyrophosphohydrolase [Cyanobacterium aponinum AL20115]WRL39719.1 nucleoside triphosphate pyrophosphohydrolase [Cyanobacterium aponinum UTEX 3221]